MTRRHSNASFLLVMAAAKVLVVFAVCTITDAFVVVDVPTISRAATRHVKPINLLALNGSSRGMGMGTTTASKDNKKNKKSNGQKGMGNNNSNGKKKNSNNINKSPFDANASLLRLEKKYDEMVQASHKAFHQKYNSDDDDDNYYNGVHSDDHLVSELVVAVRAVPSKTAATADWVPVAQLCLQPHAEVSDPRVSAAVSLYCRELAVAASNGGKYFASIPRQDLQYAVEPVESFYKFVYDPIMERNKNKQQSTAKSSNTNDINGDHTTAIASMTKQEARTVLELETSTDDRTQIKQAYRKKSFQWHPDRLAPDANKEQAALEYAKTQKAYETLSSGIRSAGTSWYASLGGRERTEFLHVSKLMGQDEARSILVAEGSSSASSANNNDMVSSAIAGLDPNIVQTFLTRNQAAGGNHNTV